MDKKQKRKKKEYGLGWRINMLYVAVFIIMFVAISMFGWIMVEMANEMEIKIVAKEHCLDEGHIDLTHMDWGNEVFYCQTATGNTKYSFNVLEAK